MLASEDGGQPQEAHEEAGSPNEEAGAPEPEAEEALEANQEQLEEQNIHEGNLTILKTIFYRSVIEKAKGAENPGNLYQLYLTLFLHITDVQIEKEGFCVSYFAIFPQHV